MSNSKKPKRSLITIGESVKRLKAENQKLAKMNKEMLEMLEDICKLGEKAILTDQHIEAVQQLIKKATEL